MVHIRLNNVSLQIPIYDAHSLRLFRRRSLKAGMVGSHDFSDRLGVLQVQALTDVSLDLKGGDRLALIGHNGAGKTSLLRYIAGTYPKGKGTRDIQGEVRLYGSIAATNPDASGYENIDLTMLLHHLPQEKREEYIRDVEDFTELGEYLSMPTRIYSAGMMARLTFALATIYTPEILLIDEDIGVADMRFASKVEKRIEGFTKKAGIMVFASHAENLLQRFCNKGAVLEQGRILYQGSIDDALAFAATQSAQHG